MELRLVLGQVLLTSPKAGNKNNTLSHLLYAFLTNANSQVEVDSLTALVPFVYSDGLSVAKT